MSPRIRCSKGCSSKMSIYGTEGACTSAARRDGHYGNTTVYHRTVALPSPRAGDNVGLQSLKKAIWQYSSGAIKVVLLFYFLPCNFMSGNIF